MSEYSTFALLDTAMIADVESKPWAKSKRRPNWIVPLYEREAWQVSPVLIDIESAYQANRIGQVLEFTNHMTPQLHVSFIDTTLSVDGLANHLRKFIYIKDKSGSELTLRIADSIVLPWLQKVLRPEQWAAVNEPIMRWAFHQRDGTLAVLPKPLPSLAPSSAPLRLSSTQLRELETAHEADELMFNLKAMRYGHQWAETPQQEIEIAEETLRLWRQSGQSDSKTLLLLARGVFDTRRALLRFPALRQILAQEDVALVRKDIVDAISALRAGPCAW